MIKKRLKISKKDKALLKYVFNQCKKYQEKYHYFGDDLCGLCAIASKALQQLMNSEGLHVEVVIGEVGTTDHCWVRSHRKVYDPTATQLGFGGPKVFSIKESHRYGYKQVRKFTTIQSVRKDFNDWPENQIPYKKTIKKFLSL